MSDKNISLFNRLENFLFNKPTVEQGYNMDYMNGLPWDKGDNEGYIPSTNRGGNKIQSELYDLLSSLPSDMWSSVSKIVAGYEEPHHYNPAMLGRYIPERSSISIPYTKNKSQSTPSLYEVLLHELGHNYRSKNKAKYPISSDASKDNLGEEALVRAIGKKLSSAKWLEEGDIGKVFDELYGEFFSDKSVIKNLRNKNVRK